MSLTDLASIASLISSAAVVISLIYLAIQVRQAQRSQRAIMQQGRTSGTIDMNLSIVDPAVASAYNKGLAGDPDMTPTEVRQFFSLARCGIINIENNFIQYKDSLLSETAFQSALKGARFMATSPGIRAVWRQTRAAYGESFTEFFDKLVADGAGEPYVDQGAAWRNALAGERARA